MKYIFLFFTTIFSFLNTYSQVGISDSEKPAPESSGRVSRVFSPKFKCDKDCNCTKTNGEKVVITNPVDMKEKGPSCRELPKRGCGPNVVTKPNQVNRLKPIAQLKDEGGGRVTSKALNREVRKATLTVGEGGSQATPRPGMTYVKEPEAFDEIDDKICFSIKMLKPGECKDDGISNSSIVCVGGKGGEGDVQAKELINFVDESEMGKAKTAGSLLFNLLKRSPAGVASEILDPFNNVRGPEGWTMPITVPFNLDGTRGIPWGTGLDDTLRRVIPGSYSRH